MKRRAGFGKFGVLALALVLALGGLGVGYASWTDTVVVEESVTTGTFCIQAEQGTLEVSDELGFKLPPFTGNDHPDKTCDIGIENIGFVDPPKSVAWGEAVWIDEDEIEITLHDVYPCYYNHFDFWVENCGTIPGILDEVILYDGTTSQVLTVDGLYTMDLNNNEHADFEIYWGNHLGDQLDPGKKWNISFGMHFIQDDVGPDMQGQSYTFTITLHFVQWNKAS